MSKPFRILSFDGGGVRGLISALWLAELERILGKRAGEVCDLVAGTSTGSLIACAVALGIPAENIAQLYRRRASEIFAGRFSRWANRIGRTFTQGISAPKYSESGLQGVLLETLGQAKLREIVGIRLLVPTYNVLSREAMVIKSGKQEFADLTLAAICCASCSAPTYFPAYVAQIAGLPCPLVDGGVVANNPTVCAIAEATRLQNEEATDRLDGCVVGSFGTGQVTRPIGVAESREWGLSEWAPCIIDVLMDGPADATDYIARQLLAEENYVRLQTRLDTAFDDMDDASAVNLRALADVAERYMESGEGLQQLERLAELLAA